MGHQKGALVIVSRGCKHIRRVYIDGVMRGCVMRGCVMRGCIKGCVMSHEPSPWPSLHLDQQRWWTKGPPSLLIAYQEGVY